MCVPDRPKTPPLPAARQAARMPDAPAVASQTRADLLRRSTMASMVLTGPGGALGAAPTAGKPVLGA